jgi:hypothetical protein
MTSNNPKANLPPGEYYILGGEEPDDKKASFRLIGERLDPEVVTQEIGLTPSRVHRKDEARPRRPGRPPLAPWRGGIWILESTDADEADERSIEDHVTHLLDRLEPRAEAIRRLCAAQDLRADFYCGYFMHQSNSGFAFGAATLARIATLDATLGFDIYGPSPEDGDRTEVVE